MGGPARARSSSTCVAIRSSAPTTSRTTTTTGGSPGLRLRAGTGSTCVKLPEDLRRVPAPSQTGNVRARPGHGEARKERDAIAGSNGGEAHGSSAVTGSLGMLAVRRPVPVRRGRARSTRPSGSVSSAWSWASTSTRSPPPSLRSLQAWHSARRLSRAHASIGSARPLAASTPFLEVGIAVAGGGGDARPSHARTGTHSSSMQDARGSTSRGCCPSCSLRCRRFSWAAPCLRSSGVSHRMTPTWAGASGLLYAANTAGAVAGTLATPFLLVPGFGVRGTALDRGGASTSCWPSWRFAIGRQPFSRRSLWNGRA